MRVPLRPLTGRWPAVLERRAPRFFRTDPRIIFDDTATPGDFATAMSAIHVGDTIKITGANRHPEPDALLIDHVELVGADIVDIGASDGSTSVELIEKLPTFGSYTIADLYFTVTATESCGHTVFFDADGECILVAGNRGLAWPSQSKLVALIYRPVIARARRPTQPTREALLLNPAARSVIAADPRVSYRVHNVFEIWNGTPPTVIKVANLLRRLYFSDPEIAAALRALLHSLDDGGYLLIVDNSRIKGMPPRGGLYRRQGERFDRVAHTENLPEIDDLIMQTRAASPV